MEFSKPQKKLLADYFQKVSIALTTAIAVRLFFDDDSSDFLIYALAIVFALVLLILGVLLSRENDAKENIHSEIKKGIFHIQNAEIKK